MKIPFRNLESTGAVPYLLHSLFLLQFLNERFVFLDRRVEDCLMLITFSLVMFQLLFQLFYLTPVRILTFLYLNRRQKNI